MKDLTGQDRAYCYHITLPDLTMPISREHGEPAIFSPAPTATVVLTEVQLLDDGVKGARRKLSFEFQLNPGESTCQRKSSSRLNWSNGTYPIHEALTIASAPDRFRILVECSEADVMVNSTRLHSDSRPSFETVRPQRTNGYESNFAKGEFDLSLVPDRNTTVPFTLYSMPIRDDLTLAFNVSGHIEITRLPN